MAANRFLGQAPKVRQVDTITVNGGDAQWATGDDCFVTVGGVTLGVEVGTTSTDDQVASLIAALINGAALVEDEGRNADGSGTFATSATGAADIGGDKFGGFAELTATASSNTVIVRVDAAHAGKPFTMTVSETTAGTGTLSIANTVPNSGPNDVAVSSNWSDGSKPGAGDTVEIRGDVELLYNLDSFESAASTSITIHDFNGRIGLPEVNEDGSLPYDEYRETHLTTATPAIIIAENVDSDRIKITTTTTNSITWDIRSSGSAEDPDETAIQLTGSGTGLVLNQYGGEVGYNILNNQTGGSFTTVFVTGGSLRAHDLTAVTSLEVHQSSALLVDCTTTDIQAVNGAVVTCRGSTDATGKLVSKTGSVIDWGCTGTTLAKAQAMGGTISFANLIVGLTVTDGKMAAGGAILDPNKAVGTWTNGIVIDEATLGDVTLDLGFGLTITPS